MILVLVSLPIIFFIVIRNRKSNSILLHKILIFLYTFYNPITNKLLFLLLLIWFLFEVLDSKWLFFLDKHIFLIFIVGTLWLLTGIIGFNQSKSIEKDEFSSYLLSPYFNGVIWSILILRTIKNTDDLKSFIKFYVLFRLIEIAFLGMFIYFVVYDWFVQFSFILQEFFRLDIGEEKRLISIATRNANEAAFLIIPSALFYIVQLNNKYNFRYLIFFIFSILALFLTYTRSGWLIFVISVLLYFIIYGKIKRIFLKYFLIISVLILFLVFFYSFFGQIKPSRLNSTDTIELRFVQYFDYLMSISKVPIFNGYYEDIWVLGDLLNTREYISSENILLDTFIKHGLLMGLIYLIFWIYSINSSISVIKLVNDKEISLSGEDKSLYAFITSIFLTLFVMANTSLFEQNSIFWILMAMVFISKRLLFVKNEI